ncbi:MAG: rhodanese-like domain-containing protein [Bacteroidia bacterium]
MLNKSSTALSLDKYLQLRDEGCLVIDTRLPVEVKTGYIPNSVFVPVLSSTAFVTWIGSVVPKDQKILLICSLGQEQEVIERLFSLGYRNIQGHLEGGLTTWRNADKLIQQYQCISAQDFAKKLQDKPFIIDVREESVCEKGMFDGAHQISMDKLMSKISEIPQDQPVYVHCSQGGKSFVAYTLLRSNGLQNVVDVAGGLNTVLKFGAELKV